MALPEPVWSYDDIEVAKEVIRNPSSPQAISSTWSKDPTKLAILRALHSCQARLSHNSAYFVSYMYDALAQKNVCFLHSYPLEVEEVHH